MKQRLHLLLKFQLIDGRTAILVPIAPLTVREVHHHASRAVDPLDCGSPPPAGIIWPLSLAFRMKHQLCRSSARVWRCIRLAVDHAMLQGDTQSSALYAHHCCITCFSLSGIPERQTYNAIDSNYISGWVIILS